MPGILNSRPGTLAVRVAGRDPVPGLPVPVPRGLALLAAAGVVTAAVLATQLGGGGSTAQSATLAAWNVTPAIPLVTTHQAAVDQAAGQPGKTSNGAAPPQSASQNRAQNGGTGQSPAAQQAQSANNVAAHQTVARAAKPAPARPVPAWNQLAPAAIDSPQQSMPVGSEQWRNAKAIVDQARTMRMGTRSAVIAVATAMQESKLKNLNYGDLDSLGLFQQRPSAGWGNPGQVTNPSYAAGAFLGALHHYQRSNPGWATQPLWTAAQSVQQSAFPSAYEQWEKQAAYMVWKLEV